jgi:hypothetical protein
MCPPDVIGLTVRMPTDDRDTSLGRSRRRSRLVVALLITGTVVLSFLALLPWISTVIFVALFGLGSSGSNK